MDIYTRKEIALEKKEDGSPLTEADLISHKILAEGLNNLGLKFPVLSEEGKSKYKLDDETFWLIDPLDGTKEFLNKNGDFTVNIALIERGSPLMGIVSAPAKGEWFKGILGIGSYKVNKCSIIDCLDSLLSESQKLPINYERDNYIIVGSRSHISVETEQFFKEKEKENKNVEVMAIGSSLKLCMVAEGRADAYPRYAPTMEWDTGAGHAIAKFAGFSVKQYNSSEDLEYNKEDLLNPWFLVN